MSEELAKKKAAEEKISEYPVFVWTPGLRGPVAQVWYVDQRRDGVRVRTLKIHVMDVYDRGYRGDDLIDYLTAKYPKPENKA